jgi:phage-related tail protein
MGTYNAPAGLALVGENGPELVRFRGGEQVLPNHRLGSIGFAGRGGAPETVHSPTFVFPGISDARMARETGAQAARHYRKEMNGPLRNVR